MDDKELKRIKALKSYGIYDTLPEEVFDGINHLASYICKTPISLISFLDDERQLIKSNIGMEGTTEVPVDISICKYTIQSDSLLEINDTLTDERTASLPHIAGDPGIRFYAGCPLITPQGDRIGTICVSDYQPGKLSEEQKNILKTLAREVVSHLEFSRKNRMLEETLKKTSEFQQLFNASNEIHCITDSEGKIEFINESVQHLLGYSVTEALGKTVWDFCVPGERERVMPAIYKAISNGEFRFQIETMVITKEGENKWFEWSDVIKDGKWLVNGRDITQRKENDKQVGILSIALEKAASGVIIRNAEGEIEWVNHATEEIIGYHLSELKGKTFGNLLIGPETDLAAVEIARQHMAERKSHELELVLYKKDKSRIWTFISNNPILNHLDQLERQVSIIVDITERKKAEEQLLKAREDAINLSKAKENFLSVMSHEMRTPLNAVIGMTRILMDEEPLERQENNLNILNFSAKNLLTLINDVLDFTKIETGNLELESIPVNISELVSKTIESLRFKTEGKDLEILYEIDERLPVSVMGDSTRLYQVFMNLLGNAVKFTEKGLVKLSLAFEEETASEIKIRFKVSDTGIGIPQDKLATIFDPYTQVGSDTSRKYGGTGLGLAITHKLVALHRSEIQIKSELNKGTTFYFSINFKKIPKGFIAQNVTAKEEVPLQGRVLIVDDNSINRILAKKVLEKWELKTDFAENGLEALNLVQQEQYDLVLMDVHMPVMDGIESVKCIRELADEKYTKLPIIALTGSVSAGEKDSFQDAGMNGYVLKPFEPSVLYKKIMNFLEPAE